MSRFRNTISVTTGIALLAHLWLGCDCRHGHAVEPEVSTAHYHATESDHSIEFSIGNPDQDLRAEFCLPHNPDHAVCNCKGACQYLNPAPVKTPVPGFNWRELDLDDRTGLLKTNLTSLFFAGQDQRLNRHAAAAARTYQMVKVWRL